MASDSLPELHVAAGILADASGRVLIARRPAGKHMSGSWEFPGGKIASGETPLQGLVRELREELGIDAEYCRFLLIHEHRYPDRLVRLYIWKVLRWRGEPCGAEGQPVKWLPVGDLMTAGLLPADEPIVAALGAVAPVNTLVWESLAAGISV